MLRSFQQMTGSEAFEKRREETAGVIAPGYAADERWERRRRGGGEGGDSGDATGRMPPPLKNSNERRTSLHVENAEKQATAAIAALETIENTTYEDLNASTWEVLKGSIGQAKAYIQEADGERQEKSKEWSARGGRDSWGSTPTRNGSPAGSWAQGNPFGPAANGVIEPAPRPVLSGIEDTRKKRQILVAIHREEERVAIEKMESGRILAAFKNEQRYTPSGQIVAVNRLRSGDLLLQTTTQEAREALEKDTKWVSEVYGSAVVVRRSFPVMIHGMRISEFDTGNQAAIKERIETENRSLHPGLEVVKARWCHGGNTVVGRGRKLYSSLVLHVATAEIADSLIRKHLIEASEIKRVERYDQAAAAIQCFNCQGEGHMARSCPNPTRCAECSQAHDTRSHQEKAPGAPKACAGCGGTGHAAYEKVCPVKVKEAQRTRQRIANKPLLYGSLRERSPPAPLERGNGFTLVGPKKKRKAAPEVYESRETLNTQERSQGAQRDKQGVGRPTTRSQLSTTAGALGQQIIATPSVPEKATQSPPQQGNPASEISAPREITYGSTLEEIVGAIQQGEIAIEPRDKEMLDSGDL